MLGRQGLIWGDLVLGKNELPIKMTQKDADAYCFAIGAHLPTKDQFEQLALDLGKATEIGYNPKPEVLPNLVGHEYWTRSKLVSAYSLKFNGDTGDISAGERDALFVVRCVEQ